MFEDIIDERKSRRNFYRDYYRKFSKALYICLIFIIIEIAVLCFMLLTRGNPEFYVSMPDGTIQQIKPAYRGAYLPNPPASLLTNQNTATANERSE